MNIIIGVKNSNGVIEQRELKTAYLAKFVDPSKEYPVSYTIDGYGNRINEPKILKGEDLTQNQIAELFSKELL